jgi:steroid delta-isomerase-like uncharacterized protein
VGAVVVAARPGCHALDIRILHLKEDVMESIEDNKRVARRYYEEVLNGGDEELLGELAAPGYVEHDPFPGQGDGIEGLRRRVALLRSSFSPCVYTVEDMVAEGDRVVVRWRSRGTHSGDFVGLPPTGRSYEMAGIDVHRLEHGRLAEHWHVVDQLALLQQLGVLPSLQPA